MRNTVITMTDSNYFKYGQRLLDTRHIVDADFICYAPDLTGDQEQTLRKHKIKFTPVNEDLYINHMQSLKFRFINKHLTPYCDAGTTFVDWDTYFLKDWGFIFKDDFALGITINKGFIEKNIYPRAWANGGVIFAKRTLKSINMCNMAIRCIYGHGLNELPEYDIIWKTLEIGRKPEKTHYRSTYRWWCDQIFLSALVMSQTNYGVKCFGKQFNNMDQETPDSYIMHLKNKSGAGAELKDG